MARTHKSSLATTLKQNRPFVSLEQEVYLSILRTASELSYAVDQFFRPFGITSSQYNVLRILRGAGTDGLCRNEISERMVTATPGLMSRLLDRIGEGRMGHPRTGGRGSPAGVHAHHEVWDGIAGTSGRTDERFRGATPCWSFGQRPKDYSQGQRPNQNTTVLTAAKGTIYYEETWFPLIRPLDTFIPVGSADCGGRAVAID